jgi:uncharacterized protein YlxW (UPF0749 family)
VTPGLTDYVLSLFNEGQYNAGAKLWQRLGFRPLQPGKCTCDAYRTLAHVLNEKMGPENEANMDEEDMSEMVESDRRIEEIIKKEQNRERELEREVQEARERVKAEAKRAENAETRAERAKLELQ